jgi:hypothetical protein
MIAAGVVAIAGTDDDGTIVAVDPPTATPQVAESPLCPTGQMPTLTSTGPAGATNDTFEEAVRALVPDAEYAAAYVYELGPFPTAPVWVDLGNQTLLVTKGSKVGGRQPWLLSTAVQVRPHPIDPKDLPF